MPHIPRDTSLLIVTDDEPMLSFLQTLFEGAGYNVETARTGAEGVALTLSKQPNLVIADSALGDLSGFRVLDIIRKTQGIEDTPIVVLTPEFPEDLPNLIGGKEACIEKPVDGNRLLRMVGLLLDKAVAEQAKHAAELTRNARAGGWTVLVASGENHFLRVASINLERQGYRVVSATSGAEALVMVEDSEPDLLVLDYDMPDMDGEQVRGKVRNSPDTYDLPVIMLIPRAGPRPFFDWKQGVDYYLTKPFNPMELITFVRRIFKSLDEYESELSERVF